LGEEAGQLPCLPTIGRFLDYLQANSTFRMNTKKSGDISQTMIVTDKADETSMISFEIRDSKFYFRLNDTLLTKAGIKLSESIKAIAINNRS
jgi:hypothetical protein